MHVCVRACVCVCVTGRPASAKRNGAAAGAPPPEQGAGEGTTPPQLRSPKKPAATGKRRLVSRPDGPGRRVKAAGSGSARKAKGKKRSRRKPSVTAAEAARAVEELRRRQNEHLLEVRAPTTLCVCGYVCGCVRLFERLMLTYTIGTTQILKEEQQLEEKRESMIQNVRDRHERQRLERAFGMERAKASERIMRITEDNEIALASKMAEMKLLRA